MKRLSLLKTNNGLNRKQSILILNKDNTPEQIENLQLLELISSLQKSHKSNHDTVVINTYLSSMTGLVELAKQSSDNYIGLLANISNVMKYERVVKNELLFHLGDSGDKFYIVFQGKVSVLIPQSQRVEMGEDEYVTYLAKLRHNQEYELLNKCINLNNDIFPIGDKDNLFAHLERILSKIGNNNFESKMSLVGQGEENRKSSAQVELRKTLIMLKKERISKFEFNLFDQDNKSNNITDLLYFSVKSAEDYIKELSPIFFVNKARGIRRFVNVFVYVIVKIYDKGDKFGEVALQNASGKRSATLITQDECHFGVLDKTSFDQCLNLIFDRLKKNNINFLITTPLFFNINKLTFVRNLYEFFTQHKVERNYVLMNENDNRKFIYFLKEGEFEVTSKRNLIEVNSIIKSIGGIIKNEREEQILAQSNKIIKMSILLLKLISVE